MAKTITRQTFVQFGRDGATSNFGKFGSQAAGLPVTTKDIATIQALAAWLGGWQDAVAAGQAPYLQDINSLFYVLAYQQFYALQEGTPEWDAGTTYFIGSIVKRPNAPEFYSSLSDANLNNALPAAGASNASWQFVSGVISSVFRVGGPLAMNAQKITGVANATAAQDVPSLAQVKVIQVVSAQSNTLFSTTALTFQSTNLAATITPASASNKVRVTVMGCMGNPSANQNAYYSMKRGSTDLSGSGSLGFGSVINNVAGSGFTVSVAYQYLDTPATASAVTYTATIRADVTSNAINFGNNSSNQIMILEEIQP